MEATVRHYRLYLDANGSFRLEEEKGAEPEHPYHTFMPVGPPLTTLIYERQQCFLRADGTPVWIFRECRGERKMPLLDLDYDGLNDLVTALIDVGAVNGKYYKEETE